MTLPALPLLASAAPADVPALLASLAATLLVALLLGELAQRIGQPAVLGELIAGIVLGPSLLGLLVPADPVIHALAELGVLVLLFEIGLHTDLGALAGAGRASAQVAVVGVAIPFALGYAAAVAFGLGHVAALVCGASLTATSIGISARVLSDLGWLDRLEGRVVLGAAVLDDIIGLVILAIVAGAVDGAGLTPLGIARLAGIAIGFVVVALLVGTRVAPPLFGVVERLRRAGALGIGALVFAFVVAWLAAEAGSAVIVGAFAAGLVLNGTPQRREIERATTPVGHFVVPIFFAAVGAAVDLRALADPRALAVGGALIVVGVAGKVAAGFAPLGFHGRRLLVGVAMIPRGEVGLIFAQMGLATGAIDPGIFGAIMLMVLATTFVTPPLLARLGRRGGVSAGDRPGDGGIDDLVAGTHPASLDTDRR